MTAQATAQPMMSAEAMLEVAGKLDLVNNVFQNGVHGSLRNTLVEVRAPSPSLLICMLPACARLLALLPSLTPALFSTLPGFRGPAQTPPVVAWMGF
jgi:hypothetical protein